MKGNGGTVESYCHTVWSDVLDIAQTFLYIQVCVGAYGVGRVSH